MISPSGVSQITPEMLGTPAKDATAQALAIKNKSQQQEKSEEAKELYQQFIGETFYGQMLKAMRSTVREPAYFHGGKTEEVFQQQLDQIFTQEISKTSAASFGGPMFDLFMNQQRIGG